VASTGSCTVSRRPICPPSAADRGHARQRAAEGAGAGARQQRLATQVFEPARGFAARRIDPLHAPLAALADRKQLGLDLAAALDRQADFIVMCVSWLPSPSAAVMPLTNVFFLRVTVPSCRPGLSSCPRAAGSWMNEPRGTTVLVIDGGLPKTLAVIRSLHRHGMRVLIAAPDDVPAAAAHSRHCAGLIRLPPIGRESEFIAGLLDGLRRHRIDAVLPLDDPVLLVLIQHLRAIQEEVAALAMPPPEAVRVALDKAATLHLARRMPNALAVPRTYVVTDATQLADLRIAKFPVLIKPRTSWGAIGIRCARNHDELIRAYAEIDQSYPRPLIQEMVEYRAREKYQLLYLFDDRGVLRMRYMHRVIAEMRGIQPSTGRKWLRGGNAALWVSWMDEDLLGRGQRLLEALGWQGFGFVECVRDSIDGQWKLMEINARFSGTIALSLAEGIDFAHGAVLAALGQELPSALNFRVGAKARHSVLTLAAAGQWRLLARCLDLRFQSPNPILSDPSPFLAALGHHVSARPHLGPGRIDGGGETLSSARAGAPTPRPDQLRPRVAVRRPRARP
jgi:biotin carboxylase